MHFKVRIPPRVRLSVPQRFRTSVLCYPSTVRASIRTVSFNTNMEPNSSFPLQETKSTEISTDAKVEEPVQKVVEVMKEVAQTAVETVGFVAKETVETTKEVGWVHAL